MDIHRQKLRPGYKAARNASKLNQWEGKPGPKGGGPSTNPLGRPPKLTGLEDRTFFSISPNRVSVPEFNRFMRPIILREYHRAIMVAGGVPISKMRLCPRRLDRVFGTVFSVQTKFGELFAQVIVQKELIDLRMIWNVETVPAETFFNIKLGRVKLKSFWPSGWDYSYSLLETHWSGDFSRIVEPQIVWPGQRGAAAETLFELRGLLAFLCPERAQELRSMTDLPWRF
jgi:hypothetical protein